MLPINFPLQATSWTVFHFKRFFLFALAFNFTFTNFLYRLIIEEFGGWDLFQTLLEVLARLAGKHHADIASVTIRAMLDEAAVSAAIIGARYADRLDKTLRALAIQLDAGDHAALSAVLAQATGPSGPVYGLERDRDGLHGRIMKYNLNQGDQSLAAEKEPV